MKTDVFIKNSKIKIHISRALRQRLFCPDISFGLVSYPLLPLFSSSYDESSEGEEEEEEDSV